MHKPFQWILLAALLIAGTGGSYALSEAFRLPCLAGIQAKGFTEGVGSTCAGDQQGGQENPLKLFAHIRVLR